MSVAASMRPKAKTIAIARYYGIRGAEAMLQAMLQESVLRSAAIKAHAHNLQLGAPDAVAFWNSSEAQRAVIAGGGE